MIGRFVRVLHSKSGLINCAGAGRRTLFILVEFFPTPIRVIVFPIAFLIRQFGAGITDVRQAKSTQPEKISG
ncbi:hypothetical protein A7J09_01525 [Streptococcus suis]